MMKSILITGATGFVGQHLIEELRNQYVIIGLCQNNAPKNDTKNSIFYYNCDLNNISLIYKIIAKHKPSFVIHLAAITHGWFDDPHKLYDVNIMGTVNLYENILKLKSKIIYEPKIIYVSSSEAYGKTTNPSSIDEKAPLFPLNHYGASKACADRISNSYASSKGLNIIIARPFTHIGPRQTTGFFVPDMAVQIAKLELEGSQHNELFVGNLKAVRDYLNVKDVVRAYRMLLEHTTKPGEIYNICSGKPIQINDLLKHLLSFSYRKIIVKQDPKRLRPSDVPVMVGSSTKLTKLTGWTPVFDLESTLSETLDYWRQELKSSPSKI